MIRITEIQNALISLVGWRDGWAETKLSKSGDYNPIESKSGLYFQDAHPLLTLENIYQTMPEGWKQGNSKTLPAYLKFLTERAISNLMQNFIRIKELNRETRDLLEERVLFYGAANRRAVIDTSKELVGFIFSPTQSMGVSIRIEKIGLQFTREITKVSGITLGIGRIGSNYPEYIVTIYSEFMSANDSMSWVSIEDAVVSVLNENNEYDTVSGLQYLTLKGAPNTSEWAIYYNTFDIELLGAAPLNIARDWSKAPCTCNRQHYLNFVEISKYLKTYPFRAAYSGGVLTDMHNKDDFAVPVAEDIRPDYHNNFGLNIQFSVGCDISDLVIRQKSLFASALQKQMASDVLREMAMNPSVRVNRNQSNVSRMEILYETDGNGTVPGGINYELEKTLKALDFDTKGLDRVCLQCKNKGVRYGTV